MVAICLEQSATCFGGALRRKRLFNQSSTWRGTIKCGRDLFGTICNLFWRCSASKTPVKPVLYLARHDRILAILNQSSNWQGTICGRDLFGTICDLFWRCSASKTPVKPVLYLAMHDKMRSRFVWNNLRPVLAVLCVENAY